MGMSKLAHLQSYAFWSYLALKVKTDKHNASIPLIWGEQPLVVTGLAHRFRFWSQQAGPEKRT